PRPERKLVPTPVLRRLQLELAREEIGARPGAVAALPQLEPARVDAFLIAFETRIERVRERAGRTRQALRSCVPRRLQAWVAALVGRRGWRSDGCRRAQNGDEEREDRPLCVHTPLMGSLRHIIGLPLRSHSCSQDACRYLWMTRSAIMSMSGYCWAAATPAKNSAGTRANGLLIMLFSFLE